MTVAVAVMSFAVMSFVSDNASAGDDAFPVTMLEHVSHVMLTVVTSA